MTPERARAVDWTLTFVAVAVAAALFGMNSRSRPTAGDGAEVMAVRQLERPLKLVDARSALPAEIRSRIGLAEGEVSAERDEHLEQLAADLDQHRDDPELLLVAGALAVAHDRDTIALKALDRVAEHDGVMDRRGITVDGLECLARGRPVSRPQVFRAELEQLEASAWLVHRTLAEHHEAAGAPERAKEELDLARDHASTYVQRFTVLLAVALTLGLLGVLVLLLWPFIRNRLIGHGLTGLEGTDTPFVTSSTQRVMVAWFLAFVGIGLVLQTLTGAASSGRLLAWNMAAQTLLQGGVAIALIQRFGRRAEDTTPLSVPLRLAAGPRSGGRLGIPLWILGGMAIALVVVAAASFLTSILGGPSPRSQPALELFAERGALTTRLVLGISVVVFAPIFEEILFRGFLYRNLRSWIGPIGAMLGSGLLFGAVHMQPHAMLPLAALGATLAFLFERSGSLIVPWAVHALWNLAQLCMVLVIAEG